ncbi:MAG: DUF2797 domain-containing protein [Bdellovibrionota bacterium]|nr:DUF2797 domain-containing protein [Bdellovibrionota bacterium]
MQFHVKKMKTQYSSPIQYQLVNSDENVEININEYLGQKLSFRFLGQIHCVNCGRETKKSFQNGYCYPCFQTLAETDMCIMKPELCHFDKGTCRDENFGKKNCLIPHVVYLSDTSSIKVGITREFQKVTRWIDQGANQAVAIWRVQSRKDAGTVEVFLKDYLGDKTNWRNMLKGLNADEDLEFKRDEILETLEDADLPGEMLDEEEILDIEYPVLQYPEKIKSLNLEKEALVEGSLEGIKGQYLIFDNGVINMRKYAGYLIEWID